MNGETNFSTLLKTMKPVLNPGDYVYCTVKDPGQAAMAEPLMVFKEAEGVTLVLPKVAADKQGLEYSFVAAWITLTVHSSLEATGFTAAFSAALAACNISCNVVAAFYHDHIFVNKNDAAKALAILTRLSEQQQ